MVTIRTYRGVVGVSFGEDFRWALRQELAFPRAFIPEMAFCERGELAEHGLSHVYNARITYRDADGSVLYTAHHIDPSSYWTREKLTLPENTSFLAMYSKVPVPYGLAVAYMKYPDWVGQGYDDNSSVAFGFEIGGGVYWGCAMWWFRKFGGANKTLITVGGGGLSTSLEATNLLPPDYLAAKKFYWIKMCRSMIIFGVMRDIRYVVILARTLPYRTLSLHENTRPYGILVVNHYVPPAQFAFIEFLQAMKNGRHVGGEVECGWDDFRWVPGDPCPPLCLDMRLTGSDALLSTQTDVSEEIITHPIPVFGYEPTLMFMANQDSTTNGLKVEALTTTGNWRLIYQTTYSGGDFWNETFTGNYLLLRLRYDPAATADIQEGMACLAPKH